MKNIILISILLIFNAFFLSSKEIIIQSELVEVKTFLKGAELIHKAKVDVNKGMHEIIIENIADSFDKNSIKVSAIGDAVILSVVQKYNYLLNKEKPKSVISLEDSLEFLMNKVLELQNERQVVDAEIDLILSNKQLSGKEKGVAVNDLKQMLQLFKTQLPELKNSILGIKRQIKKIRENITRLNNQLNQLNKKRNVPISQICISVSAEKRTELELTITYYAYDAGWKPSYDIRTEDIDRKTKLNYKAEVWQKTGVDWKNVDITLSTRNPMISGNKPILSTLYIDFEDKYISNWQEDSFDKSRAGYVGMSNRLSDRVEEKYEKKKRESKTTADFTSFSKKQLAVEFTPSIKFSIPSDNKPQLLSLQNYEMSAEYFYYAAPKINAYAYLIAKIKDWEKYNLLPAQANIYFAGSFVGRSFVNPKVSDKELVISLGRDEDVILTREILKDFTEKKFLSSDLERIFGYKNIIKNNKDKTIKIVIEEQIPVSKDEDIVISLSEKSGAKFDKITGKLKWILEIEPNGTKIIKYVFSVRHPADRDVKSFN